MMGYFCDRLCAARIIVTMSRAVISHVLFLTLAGAAFADEPRMSPMPKPMPEPALKSTQTPLRAPAASIGSWGLQHASCAEWTNACRVCSRDAAGKPQCSTPGIACTPKAITCSRPK